MAKTFQKQDFIKMNKSIHAPYSGVFSDCQQTHRFFPTRIETMQESWLLSKETQKYFSAEQTKYIFSPQNCLQPYSVSRLLTLGVIKI